MSYVTAPPMTAPVISRATPVDANSFSVIWEVTDPSHRYMITWTNLRTGIKDNVTVAENTNSYTVTGLSGIDNYDVTVAASNSCGMRMSDPRVVFGKNVVLLCYCLLGISLRLLSWHKILGHVTCVDCLYTNVMTYSR